MKVYVVRPVMGWRTDAVFASEELALQYIQDCHDFNFDDFEIEEFEVLERPFK